MDKERIVLEAHSIRLLDKKGAERVVLDTWSDTGAPFFYLKDSHGRPRIEIVMTNDNSAHINFLSPTGDGILSIGVNSEGRGISMKSDDGKEFLCFVVGGKGHG